MVFTSQPVIGVGIGLRAEHYKTIFEEKPDVPWFEAITENYMGNRALPHRHLEKIRQDYPVVLHGVSLSIGSTDPLNADYLKSLKSLQDIFQPAWVSDHLCWTSLAKAYVPDLLPLPFNEETIKHCVNRILQVQDYLGQPLVLENISSYLQFTCSEMTEWEFISAIAKQSDCYILLDINNIYVNAINHGFNPRDFLEGIPKARVKQFHLAGFQDENTHLLDTHGTNVHDAVWHLFAQALEQFGDIPTLIEWDTDIPPLSELQKEAEKAEKIRRNWQGGS